MSRALFGGTLALLLAPACSHGGDDRAGAAGSAATAGTSSGGASGTAQTGQGGSSTAGGRAGGAGRGSGGMSATGGSVGGGAGMGGSSADGGQSASGGSPAGGRETGGAGGAAGAGGAGTASGGSAGQGGDGGDAGQSSGEPGVRTVGRTEMGTAGPRFSWPGVSFAARFSGTQASIELSDAGNKNEFEVIVDGVRSSTLVTASGTTSYPVATGLTDGNHDVLVWRRTEAYYNPSEFLGFTGFSAGGALLSPPSPRAHRIEAIGDSITVGYGNTGMPGCVADTTNENNYLAYASVAARAVDADLVTIAWSGIGMYRNYNEDGPSADAMPSRYDRAVPTESDSTWDFSQFTPEAVVINLGTNDYSTKGDPGTPFVTAYAGFLAHVRSKYPNAYIFCLIQQSGSDTNINQAVSMEQSAGDARIESFDINVSSGGSGCDGHPDVAKDQAMGDKLAAELKKVMSW